ncbi:MAG: sialate O-acetylesterase [Planctomycetes bacterium]|nr:sialate O-acetylesterase [Planctomycetota bacterium]
MNLRSKLLGAWLVTTCAVSASAEVRLADVFGASMVLQRDRPLAIWGEAAPGESIEVELAERRATTLAGPEGLWRVELAPLSAGGPHELFVRGTNELRLNDVLIGDVWLCAGQSNMEWAVVESEGADEALAAAKPERMRFLRVAHADAKERRAHFEGVWMRCEPKVVEGMSAVAFHFARELEQARGVPIGIVQATRSGAPAEPFVPREVMEADPELGPALRRYARREQSEPGALFNAMIAPLAPFALRGVLWYQGESNVDYAATYRTLLPTLIQSWRATFGQPELPFLVVQLPGWGEPATRPGESAWAELREAQALSRSLPRVELAITLDLPASTAFHPREKRPIAHRLALLARARVLGEKLDALGPRMKSVAFESRDVRVRFDHAEGLRSTSARELSGFQLAGADRKWHDARARIEGEDVVVSAESVPAPVAVRYGWADLPAVDLVDGSGLPAEPFRSDDWPLSTTPKPGRR